MSRTAQHALRALLYLARLERAASAEEIAKAIGAPSNYLSKTLRTLKREGILTSARGPGGGYALAVNPADATVATIARLFDDSGQTSQCLLGDRRCDPANPCSAHSRWIAAREAAEAPMNVSIAELLLSERTGARPAIQTELSTTTE